MAELTVYGENARLKKRVRDLRKQLDEALGENKRLHKVLLIERHRKPFQGVVLL